MKSYAFIADNPQQDDLISRMLNSLYRERGFDGVVMYPELTLGEDGEVWAIDQDNLEKLLKDLCLVFKVEPVKLEVPGQLSLF